MSKNKTPEELLPEQLFETIKIDEVNTNLDNQHSPFNSKQLKELSEIQKLIKQNQIETQAELAELKERTIKNSKFTEVENMLRDKAIISQSEFTEKGAKQAGMSAGYVATEKKSGNTFILKQFYKTYDECLNIKLTEEETKKAKKVILTEERRTELENSQQYIKPDEVLLSEGEKELLIQKRKQAINNRRDGVRELISSTMYQFLLYDQTPKEGLVQPDREHQDSLYVRSKFFNNVVPLTEFSGAEAGATYVEASNKNLKKLEGFEKVIAACHILGEGDYHAGNLMVQDGKTINKIDHGKSFIEFYQDFGAMVHKTHEMFSHPGVCYGNAIKAGNLSFNIDKYSKSLNQMITQFDEKQMEAIVDQKVDELKKSGFDPKGINATAISKIGESKMIEVYNFDDLRKLYKDNIKINFTNMKEVAKAAEVLTKFSNVSHEFKQGNWLETFAKSPIKDPVEYAIHNDIQIEGKNAQDWAYQNDYQIKVSKGFKQEVVQEKQWQKNTEGKWERKEVPITKSTKIVENFSPVTGMHNKDRTIGEKLKPLIHDFAKQLLVEASDKEKGLHTFLNEKVSLRQMLKEGINDEKVSDKKVKGFFDKICNELKKEQYLTNQDINAIKNKPDYEKNINDTVKLINSTTPNLTIIDKVYYMIAKFCEKIGLTIISNYLTEKISPANLNKLNEIENVVAKSLKIGAVLLQNTDDKVKRPKATKQTFQAKLKDRQQQNYKGR